MGVYFPILSLVYFLALALTQTASAGTIFRIDMRVLRPTQMAVGMREVKKKQKIVSGLSKKASHSYLLHPDRIFPVIQGPEGTYVIDHHHLGLALIREKKYFAFGEELHDWSEESPENFWKLMQEHPDHYLYLKDEKGKLKKIEDLPKRLIDLKDDPYRSLAYFVKREEGFKKDLGAYYIEFQWADFFRSRIRIGSSDKDFEKAIKDAVALAHSPIASYLPGYIP